MPTLDLLRAFDNSAEGAYLSAYNFCMEFKQPEHAKINAEVRGRYAFQTVYPALFSDGMQPEIQKEVVALNTILGAATAEEETQDETEIGDQMSEEEDKTEDLEEESAQVNSESSEIGAPDSDVDMEGNLTATPNATISIKVNIA